MEKVTITAVAQKGLTKKGNPYYTVTLADGRLATCFDKEIPNKVNQEIEADIKQTEYNGELQYVMNLPGSGFQRRGSGFNLEFNQRKCALESACASVGMGTNEGADILRRADKFLEWMKKE